MKVSGQKNFPKTDEDTICRQGTEQITFQNSSTVIAICEIHQSTDIAHRNGVEHIVQKEEQYLRCATCNLSVKERDNFYLHQCIKHMKVKGIYHCSHCKMEFSNDYNKKPMSLGVPKKNRIKEVVLNKQKTSLNVKHVLNILLQSMVYRDILITVMVK